MVYSAVFTKANVKKGDNVLITGIGGGVAILALQLCVAAGTPFFLSFECGSSQSEETPILMSTTIIEDCRCSSLGLVFFRGKDQESC